MPNFSFKLTFSTDTYLSSAWNGALEIHQNVQGDEIVATIPDLREFNPGDYPLKTFTGFIDAMNTNRVYRKRLDRDRIISELETNKGTQFDPKVADVMLELIRNGKISIAPSA